MDLYEHQIENSRVLHNLINHYGSACDRSEMGTGKTFTAANVSYFMGLRTIVVCPKSTISQWTNVMKEFGHDEFLVTNYEQIKTGKLPIYNKLVGWKSPTKLFIIFDEAHRCKGRNTQNSKLLLNARKNGHKILLLSATLISSSLDLKAIGFGLGLFVLPSSWFVYARRFGAYINDFGGYDASVSNLHSRNLSSVLDLHGVRTTVSSLSINLPCINSPELVDFPTAARIHGLYEALKDQLKDDEHGAPALAARMLARQQAELLKVDLLAKETQDLVAQGYSVILFVNFTKTVQELFLKLGYSSSVIVGGQSARVRESEIARFQCNSANVLISNIKAGGVGLSLHDTDGGHPRVALISPPDSAVDLIQVLGRIRRVGMKSPAVNRILFAADTIEEKVYKNVRCKIHQIETINDGDLDVNQRILSGQSA